MICQTTNNLLPGDEQQELILDGQLTCKHCRFYKEFLTQAYFQATHQTAELPRAVTLVQDSLSDRNMEIQLVWNVVSSSLTKFSVQSTSFSFSIVSLKFPHGKMCARCSNGVAMHNGKSIPKNATKEDRKPVCSHIKTMHKEMQYIESIFPEYFQESAQSDGDVQGYNFQFAVNPEMEVNNEDGNIVQNIPGHFNINTGLWEYESLSKHTQKDMMHPQNV